MKDPEPCLCGDKGCPECYPRHRFERADEPEDRDEFGRYERPEDLYPFLLEE